MSESSSSSTSKNFLVSGTKFTVTTNYDLIKTIGSGAYGVVASAHDRDKKKKVAIKKIPSAFDDIIDGKRILREIKLMKHFCHENVIALTDILFPTSFDNFEVPKSFDDFNDVYLVTDLMETDLHRIIYSQQALTDDHIQYFVYQMLRALKYIHSANVIHRDLKPSNLLLNSNCDLKVCDFGLARGVNNDENGEKSGDLTEYVVTRWYRAPEIMLAVHEYSNSIDIWAVGCIMAELLGRKPLFPGDDYIHQLQIITEFLGKPSDEDLEFVTSEKAKRFMKKQLDKPPVDPRKKFPKANEKALDLLMKMLHFVPTKRISVTDALQHPYLESLHNEDDEPVCSSPFVFELEGTEKLDKRMLQELILEEIESFHPEQVKKVTKNLEGNWTVNKLREQIAAKKA